MDTWHYHAEFEVGAKVLLSTRNLHLHGTRKFRDRLVGLLVMTEHYCETAYRLDLSYHVALYDIHHVFHVLLLCGWQDNSVHAAELQIEIDGEDEYEVLGIKEYREYNGKL